jgi:glycerate kinase
MKVLVAPDSFKGSMTAKEAANAIKRGILKAGSGTEVRIVPMADGGEGTMVSLVEATDGSIHEARVENPLGRLITGQYGITGDGHTAVVELASASGLDQLTQPELDPCAASTYGTGQLIRHALDRGIRHFIICLGGSATNDAGTGLLAALGYRFLDSSGNELGRGGLALQNLHSIDHSNVNAAAEDAKFEVACDVNNPLVGPNGASAVFGPQKGASPKGVERLEAALSVFADCVERDTAIPVRDMPGAGAAGGTAAGLAALLNGELRPGIRLVMEALQFEETLRRERFDYLVTGEGKIDGQTASGKVVAGLSEATEKYRVPTLALAGAVEGSLVPLYDKGLTAAFSIVDRPMPLEQAIENAEELIEKQAERIFRLILRKG